MAQIEGYITTDEARERLGYATPRSVRTLIERGQLDAVKLSARVMLISAASVERYKATKKPKGRPKTAKPKAKTKPKTRQKSEAQTEKKSKSMVEIESNLKLF